MKIIVSLPDQQNEFQLLQAADARETAERLGVDVEILDAEGSPVLQIQQLVRALHARQPGCPRRSGKACLYT